MASSLRRGLSLPGLELVRVLLVAAVEVRERHRDRVMLHLPDVAELVRDQIVAGLGPAHEDDEVRRVAVEAAEPRQPEEQRRDDDPYAGDTHGAGIEVERVEPRLRAK